MIYLRDTMTPPAGGWRYPSLGKSRETDLGAQSYIALLALVDKHYRLNGAEPPGDEAVSKWLCDNFPLPCLQDRQVYDNPWTRMEPTPIHLRPIPYTDWPVWMKVFKMTLGKPEDRGAGDTVVRIIGPDNSEAFKNWFREKFNVECGCVGRQDRLNLNYPYST
jgi:hypothetical protein